MESIEETYTVGGMTCEHCRAAVVDQVKGLPGVSDVRVDLARGVVIVRSHAGVSREELVAAVHEAGYEVRR